MAKDKSRKKDASNDLPPGGLSPEEEALLASLDASGASLDSPESSQAKKPSSPAKPSDVVKSSDAGLPADGLTAEERAMLAALSGEGGEPEGSAGTSPAPAAPQPQAPPDEDMGLTSEERAMLGTVSAECDEAAEEETPAPAEPVAAPGPVAGAVDAETVAAEPEVSQENRDSLSPEEQEMLAMFASGGIRAAKSVDIPNESPGPKQDKQEGSEPAPQEGIEESLTPEEREMLAALGGDGAQPPAAESGPAKTQMPAAVTQGEALTSQEKAVLQSAKAEGERVAREELPQMFGRDVSSSNDETPYLAEAIAEAVVIGDEGAPRPRGLVGRILTAPIDAINYPFRRISSVARLGLGLAGVLLLLTLLLIKLFQVLIE